MIFQNFYTLIFKKLTPKQYITYFFIILLTIYFISFLLNRLDLTLTGNDLIRKYQLNKLNTKEFKGTDTIIIGDSSAGNAIDANYFGKLSKSKTYNLSLTGSWGLIGSLGILKKALEKEKNIHNIIIIQTLDIWGRDFANESVLELFSILDTYKYINMNTIFSYYVNPQECIWNLKYPFIKTNIQNKIDHKNDYVVQKTRKYSNKQKIIHENDYMETFHLSKGKVKELDMLQNFCKSNNLNCIFMHGPIHQQIAKSSIAYINNLNISLNRILEIQFIPTLFSYTNNCIGDSLDHVNVKCKKTVTSEYFQTVKKYLY